MKFTLTIDMDNDSFADDHRPELARVLCIVVAQISAYPVQAQFNEPTPLRDINGNRCGTWEIEGS